MSYKVTASIIVPIKDESSDAIQKIRDDFEVYRRHVAYSMELIIVDDGSVLPVPDATLRHPQPRGYGAALMSGIRYSTGLLIATMDGDGQHRLWDVIRLVDFSLHFSETQMVIGNRRLTEPSWRRKYGRKLLNMLATFFTGRWIPDLNSGLRVFRRHAAIGYLPILCPAFSFTTSLTMSMLADNHAVDWVPIKVYPRPNGRSHVHVWSDGWVTLKYIVWIGIALRTRRIRAWMRPVVRKLLNRS